MGGPRRLGSISRPAPTTEIVVVSAGRVLSMCSVNQVGSSRGGALCKQPITSFCYWCMREPLATLHITVPRGNGLDPAAHGGGD